MQDLACILFCFVASVTTFREARQLEIILSRQKAGRDLLVTFIARGYRLQSEFRVLLPNGSNFKSEYNKGKFAVRIQGSATNYDMH